MRARSAVTLLIGIASGAGCSLITDLSGLSGGSVEADAGGDATNPNDARIDDSATSGDAGADAACPGTGGPTPVRVDGVCVDSTEVSNAEYKPFLAANVSTASQPSYCAWNSNFEPPGWPVPDDELDYPVVNVDWCDAYAFCAWSGKRLCGAIGGGSVSSALLGNPAADQWYVACSAGGTLVYPYGATYEKTACDSPIGDAGPPSLVSVGSDSRCVGGGPGVFDMSGNADEWVDSCDGTAGSDDDCRRRSGSYQDPAGDEQTCKFSRTAPRNAYDTDISFRCCGP